MRPLRLRPLVLVLLVLALPLPSASAEEDDAWLRILDDAQGDVDTLGLGFFLNRDPEADLVEVSVREEDTALRLRLASAGADPGPVPLGRHESLLAFTVEQRFAATSGFELRADADGFRLAVDGQEGEAPVEVVNGSTPTRYEVVLPLSTLMPGGNDGTARLVNAFAEIRTYHEDGRVTHDTAQDGVPFPFTPPPRFRLERPWAQAVGADFAAGPSVAVDPDGLVHVAYVVTKADHGTPPAVYHALLRHGRLWKESVDNVTVPAFGSGTSLPQTALAVDARGDVHLLFESGSRAGVRYATDADGWRVEDPTRLADGVLLRIDDGPRASPTLVAGSGRVVAALQAEGADRVHLVERDASGAWRSLRTLEPARLARLALDADGKLHAAWLRPTTAAGSQDGGALVHASERGGWAETLVASGVLDGTRAPHNDESDGSFAFALGPGGVPHFAYETSRQERGFVVLRPDGAERETTPLRPPHGNPQTRMRMAVDDLGRAHLVTGYGGSDLYAIRSPEGAWHVEEIPRYDSFALALTRDGRAAIAHVQPHGGATLAVAYHPGPETEEPIGPFALARLSDAQDPEPSRPSPGAGAIGALVALAVGAAASRRRR